MASVRDLPPNVHISSHPCLLAKLSQLRLKATPAKDVKSLVHDISLILGCDALATSTTSVQGPKDETHLGFPYDTATIAPQTISLIPILRSGLAMVDALQTILPDPVPVHHLGLYREPSTLEPVEYYNNLPHHIPDPTLKANSTSAAAFAPSSTTASALEAEADGTGAPYASSLAIILDPVIATGGTCAAAIQTLKEWGARRIVVLSIVGATEGVRRAAEEWPEATEIWLAAVDPELTGQGMIKPGLGDIGDRLFLTIGK
ncbi:PRTase-like protein [Sodiomyces alkalinus F11]|uniref:uracil phosphoribosyltransferase n=1 Tax=Sodiomyces alkalinus (strain CBS 110278 / VKM F-3762 / F11) TaxID=1314773 RepID=A0A3N2Q5I3_SODAK|nr:PRTase-like protein [Sodiomyces alkalinus F11]ROT42034.1 PRTase-like protein [Sodiomyces alkalinus F11]